MSAGWLRLWLFAYVLTTMLGGALAFLERDLSAKSDDLSAKPPKSAIFYPARDDNEIIEESYSASACVPGTISAHVVSERDLLAEVFSGQPKGEPVTRTVYSCTGWPRALTLAGIGFLITTTLGFLALGLVWIVGGFRSRRDA
jgi:hypothetical protein